MIRFF
jgi:hypothetical protein